MAPSNVRVTISYRKPGTQPPIFVAGTFSGTEWEPQEMNCTTDEDGEYSFKKEVTVEAGIQVQYKFRVGEGDWWVLNEDAPTATDDAGNRNNILQVPSATSGDDSKLTKQSPQPSAGAKATDQAPASGAPTQQEKSARDSPRPLPKAVAQLAATATPESGRSTPAFARTAAEVADSAALLDKDEPEPEIADEEAGRIGIRRLSATPIPEVARTAAEVADTAERLDRGEPFVVELLPRPLSHDELISDDDFDFGEPIIEQDSAPLFAHECAPVPGRGTGSRFTEFGQVEEDEDFVSSHVDEGELSDADLNDPTLERFPSNRDQIMETVRKLETGLNEDRETFEGVPPSPVVGISRRGTNEITGYQFVASPSASPIMTRSKVRLDIPRSSQGSISSDWSSAVSLHSISEAEGDEFAEDEDTPVIQLPKPIKKPAYTSLKPSASDDDEGVVMKSRAESWAETARDGEDSDDGYALDTPKTPQTPRSRKPHDAGQRSPQIVIQSAEEIEQSAERNGALSDDQQPGDGSAAASTSVEVASAANLKKRAVDRATTPNSVHSTGKGTNEGTGWLAAFLRVLFVDWIGGLLARLWGTRRKT